MATAKLLVEPEMVYRWRGGYRAKVAPEVAGTAVEAIRSQFGFVTPAAVVAASRPKNAPLHRCFPWNDREAAHQRRLEVARGLIAALVTIRVINNQPEPVRVYLHVKPSAEQSCYVTTEEAMSREDYRRQVLGECLALLRGLENRYRYLTELEDAGVGAAIDRFAKLAGLE